MANKHKITFTIFTIIALVVILAIPTFADYEAVGYIQDGNSKIPFVGSITYSPTSGSVDIYIPLNTRSGLNPMISSNERISVLTSYTQYGLPPTNSVKSWEDTGHRVFIYNENEIPSNTLMVGTSSTIRKLPSETAPELVGIWTFPSDVAVDYSMFSSGVTKWDITGQLISDAQTINFQTIGVERGSSYFNMWVEDEEWGTEYIIGSGAKPVNNPVLTITDVPDAIPGRLLGFLVANASYNSFDNPWQITITLNDTNQLPAVRSAWGTIKAEFDRLNQIISGSGETPLGHFIDTFNDIGKLEIYGVSVTSIVSVVITGIVMIWLLKVFFGG